MATPTAIGTSARAEASPKGPIAVRINCSRWHPICSPRNCTGASTCSTWRATRSSATAAKNCTPMTYPRCAATTTGAHSGALPLTDRARSTGAARGLDQPVGKFDAFIEGLNTDALIASMGAIFIDVLPHAADVIAHHPCIAGPPVVAEPGRHGGNDGHIGPHRMRELGDFFLDLRGRRRLRAHDRRRIQRVLDG